MKLLYRTLFQAALAWTFLFMLVLTSSAQIQQPAPRNPEAAALAKSLAYPVNNNSGVPNISIPIFSVNGGSIGYDVKLSYHAGGTKVGQLPTWVGLNWSMNAAPQITRTVHGRDDLYNYIVNNTFDVYNPNRPRPDNFYLARLARGEVDEEPDEFNYSLMNKSGSFYFQRYANQTYKALPVPYDQLDIVRNSQGGFTIVDDDGTKYEFGGAGCEEHSNMSGAIVSTTAWKCRMIVSPNKKDTITFDYYPMQYKYRSVYTDLLEVYDVGGRSITFDPNSVSTDIIASGAELDFPPIFNLSAGIPNPFTTTYFVVAPPNPNLITYDIANPNIFFATMGYAPEPTISTSIMQNIALRRISFKGNKIEFFARQQADEILDSIKITNYLGECVKTIKLDRYFNLSAVKFSDGHSAEEVYQIEYDINGFAYDENLSSDAWGYPNPSNWNLFPTSMDIFGSSNLPFQWIDVIGHADVNSPNVSNNYRIPIGRTVIDANEDDIKGGIIKKIIYPTGGYTEFEFEANRYKQTYNNDIKIAGGLRVKSIKDYKAPNTIPATEKYFKYAYGLDDVGALVILPALTSYEYTQNGHWDEGSSVGHISQGYNVNFRKRTFVKSSLDNTNFSNGAPVNYQTVTVYESTDGHQTGKSVFNYNIHHSDFRIVNTPLTQHQLVWDNSALLSETQYAYINGDFEWIKSKSYQYEDFILPEQIHVGKAFNTHILSGYTVDVADPEGLYGIFNYLTYGLNVGYNRIKKEIESSRALTDLSKVLTSEKNYYYENPNHTYATRISYLDSKNEEVNEYTAYPQDYLADNMMVTSLINNHKLRLPVESVVAKKGAVNAILKGNINMYENSPQNYYKYSLAMETNGPVPLSAFKFSNVMASYWPENATKQAFYIDTRYVEKQRADAYDNYGNVIQVTNKEKQVTTFIWAYKGSYPVMEIKNLDKIAIESVIGYGQIDAFASTSPTKAVLATMAANIKAAYPNCMISYYTYKPLIGMTSSTDTKEMTTYFEYDVFQRLKNIKDQNGNIVKSYCYNYYNQQVNCYIDPAPAPQSGTVYVKKIITASGSEDISGTMHDYIDYSAYYYEDAACTLPLTLTGNLTIKFSESGMTTYNNGNPATPLYHVNQITGLAGTSSTHLMRAWSYCEASGEWFEFSKTATSNSTQSKSAKGTVSTEKARTVKKGLPPGEDDPGYCYSSTVSLVDFTGYIVKSY